MRASVTRTGWAGLVLPLMAGASIAYALSCAPPPPSGLDEFDCAVMCGIEDDCGLRSAEECEVSSCVDGVRISSTSDACIDLAEVCSEAALCVCEEACAKIADCTGSEDQSCVQTCEILGEQEPVSNYQEKRCVIESSCEEIATCG